LPESSETHRNLSKLGLDAHRQAAVAIKESFPPGSSLARRRGFVRTALEGVLAEIDEQVKILLKIT
jgi:hypothetical protein